MSLDTKLNVIWITTLVMNDISPLIHHISIGNEDPTLPNSVNQIISSNRLDLSVAQCEYHDYDLTLLLFIIIIR
jgi:hypothetical protein